MGDIITCKDPPTNEALRNYQTVKGGVTYEFTPSDLEKYSARRFGYTYGVLVVPNKVFISNREFVSSSSLLPYVGYQSWGPGATGAVVVAAGVGTAPPSTQSTNATGSGTSNGSQGPKRLSP